MAPYEKRRNLHFHVGNVNVTYYKHHILRDVYQTQHCAAVEALHKNSTTDVILTRLHLSPLIVHSPPFIFVLELNKNKIWRLIWLFETNP